MTPPKTSDCNSDAMASFSPATGSAEWDATLVANVVANCRQQIERLRMKMPMNVALALGRADEELADCQAWMRAESNFGTYANPPNSALCEGAKGNDEKYK